MGRRDPGLLAVEDEVALVVGALGPAREVADVRTGLGLGHRDRLDPPARDPAEDLLLLLVGAEALVGTGDDQAHAVAGDRQQSTHRLLEEDAGVDHPAARAPVRGVDRHPEPAQLGELFVELLVVELGVAVREPLSLLPRPGLALAEVADRGPEVALLVGEAVDLGRRRGHRDAMLGDHGRRRGRAGPISPARLAKSAQSGTVAG